MIEAKSWETADALKRRALQQRTNDQDNETHIHLHIERGDDQDMPQPDAESYGEVYYPRHSSRMVKTPLPKAWQRVSPPSGAS